MAGKSPKSKMKCGQVKRSTRPGKKIMKLYCSKGKRSSYMLVPRVTATTTHPRLGHHLKSATSAVLQNLVQLVIWHVRNFGAVKKERQVAQKAGSARSR